MLENFLKKKLGLILLVHLLSIPIRIGSKHHCKFCYLRLQNWRRLLVNIKFLKQSCHDYVAFVSTIKVLENNCSHKKDLHKFCLWLSNIQKFIYTFCCVQDPLVISVRFRVDFFRRWILNVIFCEIDKM